MQTHDVKIIQLFCFSGLILIIFLFMKFVYPKILDASSTSDLPVSDSTAAIAQAASSSPIVTTEHKIICLDPGHGGSDTGAVYNGINESDINLQVALIAKSLLEYRGYQVVLTRTDDLFVPKRHRAVFCNSKEASILISIHHNSYDSDKDVDYSTALYYKDTDKKLASSLLNAISNNLKISNPGISKFNNSLLWIAKMPATLSESFFLSNRNELKLLKDLNFSRLNEEAGAIVEGIDNYFNDDNLTIIPAESDNLILNRND